MMAKVREHVLVCLSTSPSNEKIIRTAARMAEAFRGDFTALYVETTRDKHLTEKDRQQLRKNTELAVRLRAKHEIVYGTDVAFQIAEFSKRNNVTCIIMGKSLANQRILWKKPNLTERLIAQVTNLDIHIIPDQEMNRRESWHISRKMPVLNVKDLLVSFFVLSMVTCIGLLFQKFEFSTANIIMLYILGVLLVSVITSERGYSLALSLVSVIVFNFFFTDPRYTLWAYDKDYPITFLVMLIVAFITGSLAARLKSQAKMSANAAYRTKLLLDTNHLLVKARERQEILNVTAEQIVKLFRHSLWLYTVEGEDLSDPIYFSAQEEKEKHIPSQKNMRFPIHINQVKYGFVEIEGEDPLDTYEKGILQSILGECALALENEQNAREKENAAILVQKEQFRANLLRSISHDLRTPLTSISGNAANLLNISECFDESTKHVLYEDIYDDSMWLITLVENILAVTKMEEGNTNLKLSSEVVDEVVTEAIKHIDRRKKEHTILVQHSNEILLAQMDVGLILQVLINLINNAIKYTPKGSVITVSTKKQDDMVAVTVQDNGPGIQIEEQPHIFDMFYSGEHLVADGRRSLGLGLFLCKSIVQAHGGTILVDNCVPEGATFTFTLPIGEVHLDE